MVRYRINHIPGILEGYGSISKNSITKICETKFGAKPYRDSEKGRGLIFNQKTLNKLIVNYSIIDGIKIIKEEKKMEKRRKRRKSLILKILMTLMTLMTLLQNV